MTASEVALITGASSGIGRAIALRAGRHGWAVGVNYRSHVEAAEEVVREVRAAGGEAMAIQADVTDGGQVAHMVDAVVDGFGAISVLVNNVGDVIRRVSFLETDEALWDAVMAFNLRSAFLCTRRVLPHMLEARRGSIVNVSSLAARTGGAGSGVIAYGAAKAGLEAMTVGLARDYAGAGVRVNAVQVGIVQTLLHARTEFDPAYGDAEGFIRRVAAAAPLKRAAVADEIAAAVMYLASDEASYVTGSVLTVAGGL
jgi:NAD(P)-dependent dehydrogenase (short-subunit alcohol dehydrogenase family)